jgi:hypothetical protein
MKISPLLLTRTIAASLAVTAFFSAKLQAGQDDFMIQPLDGTSVTATQIEIRLAAFAAANPLLQVSFVNRIDMPHLDFNMVVANFGPTAAGTAAAFAALPANADLIVEEDRQALAPVSATSTPWPVASGLPGTMFPNAPAYPALADIPTMASRPEIYVVDTGIQSMLGVATHPAFASTRIAFGPGILPDSLKALAYLNDPYQDPSDHGTSVASAAAGLCGSTPVGSLMKWPNTRCTLISARIYGPPSSGGGAPTAWITDAVSAIAQCANCHLRTWRDSIVGNEGGVLVFSHRLIEHYSPSLEMALWNAWNKGCMTVVCSAGNTLSTTWPTTPTIAMPAGNLLATSAGTTSPGRIPTSWVGFISSNLWARTTAPSYVPGNDYLIMAGGSNEDGGHWNVGGGVGSNRGLGIDVWAPAANVPVASSASSNLISKSGTSFSAGYAAGLAAYYLSHRPFATGPAVKKWIQTTANGLSSTALGITTSPGAVVKPRLTVTTTTAPTIPCQYTDWRSDCALGAAPTVTLQTDNDTVANGIEFALGTHPRISDKDAHTACEVYDAGLATMVALPPYPPLPSYNAWVAPFTIQTYKSYLMNYPLTGVICHWEISPNLTTWTPAPLTNLVFPIRAEGYMHQGLTPLNWTSGFFRIRVTTD